jgi:hypothetical protein
MCQTRIAERTRQRGRQSYEQEGSENGEAGKYGRDVGAPRLGEEEVDVPCCGGEEGLHCVEKDGEFEAFMRGAVGSGGEAFLEEGPCETGK